MIFVTLGSQKFPFNRLLIALDDLKKRGHIKDEIFVQIGFSDYEPKCFGYERFLDRTSFAEKIRQSDIVITHGGTGAIIGAVKAGKKVIAVPRLAQYGEHVDDHQLQLVTQFAEMDLICQCDDCMKLAEAIETVRNKSYRAYKSNTNRIIESIEKFLEEEQRGDK